MHQSVTQLLSPKPPLRIGQQSCSNLPMKNSLDNFDPSPTGFETERTHVK